jgi:methylenetetrahydrofolate dehydrogenase (NADP+)/methenyltetrahydrofolate cyclohydrolase
MAARILDGRSVASRLWRDLSERVASVTASTGGRPRLAIVRFAPGGPTALYADGLARAAKAVGIEPLIVTPPEGIALGDLVARIGALNRDPSVAGIVLAQPLPDHLELPAVVEAIDPDKDVDGATPLNAGRLARGEPRLVPATALAIMTILDHYQVPIAGRRAVVVGRSAVVGRPVAALLLAADATVEICHSRTRNLARETRRAEILVVAAGVPGLITAEMVGRSCVVVDAGISTTPAGVVGDVDFERVRQVVAAITPVPGGVGPVTTMALIRQTVEAAERQAARVPASEELDRFAPRPDRPVREPRARR